jgi:hypothetical protein
MIDEFVFKIPKGRRDGMVEVFDCRSGQRLGKIRLDWARRKFGGKI